MNTFWLQLNTFGCHAAGSVWMGLPTTTAKLFTNQNQHLSMYLLPNQCKFSCIHSLINTNLNRNPESQESWDKLIHYIMDNYKSLTWPLCNKPYCWLDRLGEFDFQVHSNQPTLALVLRLGNIFHGTMHDRNSITCHEQTDENGSWRVLLRGCVSQHCLHMTILKSLPFKLSHHHFSSLTTDSNLMCSIHSNAQPNQLLLHSSKFPGFLMILAFTTLCHQQPLCLCRLASGRSPVGSHIALQHYSMVSPKWN